MRASSESALSVYSGEYRRTGFQGGLNWYRCSIGDEPAARPPEGGLAPARRDGAQRPGCSSNHQAELQVFAGRRIEVPALFIAGRSVWGVHQKLGAVAAMQALVCPQLRGVHLVEGAGHWVQQEQPAAVNRLLIDFLRPG